MTVSVIEGKITRGGLRNVSDVIMGAAARRAIIPAPWRTPEMQKTIAAVGAMGKEALTSPEGKGWNPDYRVESVPDVVAHDKRMGDALAAVIHQEAGKGSFLDIILPVGPMGQYEYTVARLNEWKTPLDRTETWNMDEWARKNGTPIVVGESFQYAMGRAFFSRLNNKFAANHFATRDMLPRYAELMAARKTQAKSEGKEYKKVVVHGIGQITHLAFIEEHLARVVRNNAEDWKRVQYVLGMPLSVMTIMQNILTSADSDIFGIPAYANTIGPWQILSSDYIIGGCDGALCQPGRPGMVATWQKLAVHMTFGLAERNIHVPSTFGTQIPGVCFVLEDLLKPVSMISH
ncbi:MAG: hypothetical protein NTZ10_00115 [Candidatus Saganbacteria bacterium]|nr:hypothetical protein [Candidatus Saganbacteria bacterium]